MNKQIERLEAIKKQTKTQVFKDVIDKKIEKLRNGSKINKYGY